MNRFRKEWYAKDKYEKVEVIVVAVSITILIWFAVTCN